MRWHSSLPASSIADKATCSSGVSIMWTAQPLGEDRQMQSGIFAPQFVFQRLGDAGAPSKRVRFGIKHGRFGDTPPKESEALFVRLFHLKLMEMATLLRNAIGPLGISHRALNIYRLTVADVHNEVGGIAWRPTKCVGVCKRFVVGENFECVQFFSPVLCPSLRLHTHHCRKRRVHLPSGLKLRCDAAQLSYRVPFARAEWIACWFTRLLQSWFFRFLPLFATLTKLSEAFFCFSIGFAIWVTQPLSKLRWIVEQLKDSLGLIADLLRLLPPLSAARPNIKCIVVPDEYVQKGVCI